MIGSPLLSPQPYDDVDAGDLIALWRYRGLTKKHRSAHGDVHEFILVFNKKVMVSGIVGVEVGFGRIDRDLAQQTELGSARCEA